MKRILLILIFAASLSVYSQEKISVTFKIETPTLSDSDRVYIVGNTEEIGNWNPSKVMLDKISNELRQKTLTFEKGTTIEYKFTKGSWQTEALKADTTVPPNAVLKVEHDTTINSVINYWRDKFNSKVTANFKVQGQITGKVEYYKNFAIDGLKPRDIIIWLPPDYEKEINKRYPVLYMHDAQNIFDPRTSTNFIDWQVDETADSLIRNGVIQPIIMVGMNNTVDRSIEYSDTPLGRLYMKFIIEKVKPFVDSKYRTLADAKNTAVAGSSMGGLISMMCAWEHPEVFSKAACFSPAFKFRDINYVNKVLEYTGKKKKITLYIDNGGVDLDAQLMPGVNEMVNILEKKEFSIDKDLFVYIDKAATHNEAAWAKRVWRPLKIFFGK
ncbi:MAG: alpha/beta hydrolase-fold protein [Ignavibacteriales bacterium]|nr:alpha/beta hydrolase-fold protein [Ignavibacteriales bacterium]